MKTRIPRRALQRVFNMACEMSGEVSYLDHDDETGICLGLNSDVRADLEAVKRAFKLRGRIRP